MALDEMLQKVKIEEADQEEDRDEDDEEDEEAGQIFLTFGGQP